MTFANGESVGSLFHQLCELDEHQQIEAKTSEQVGKSLLETVCAFSNEPSLGGGYILVGVAMDTERMWPAYKIIGVDDPDKISSEIATQCATSFNRPVRPEITVERINQKQVIGILVPESQINEKPVHFKNQGLPRGAFRRIGSTDQRCTEDDLVVFYQHQQVETYDQTIILDTTIDDLDQEAIADYRKSRTEANPDAEELRWDDIDLLDALGCISRREEPRRPTVAGILLFGKARAIRRYFPMMRVDYIRVPGKEWVSNPDQSYETIEMRGPLMRLIRRVHTTILDDLPKGFFLPPGEMQRREAPIIPARAIREAVVNAVMHRSYRLAGPVQIIRYGNRLEVRNPGHSLVSEDRLGEPGSQTRNPRIAAVLHETRFAETKGSGIRIMRDLMESADLTPPAFESDREGNRFVAVFLFHHFLGPEDIEWLKNFHEENLTDEEARAMILIREFGAINNVIYRTLNHVDTLNASQHLRRLRDLGFLHQKGRASATYYVPTERFQSAGQESSAAERKLLPHELTELPQELGPLTQELAPLSHEIKEIPQELHTEVKALGSRGHPEDVKRVINRLCDWKPLRTEELARILGRGDNYILRTYLNPMLREGLLERTIPDNPQHPKQAYRTTLKGRNW